MEDLDFLEAMACVGGCVGGPLTVENNFVAQQRIKKLTEKWQKNRNNNKVPGEDEEQGMYNKMELDGRDGKSVWKEVTQWN